MDVSLYYPAPVITVIVTASSATLSAKERKRLSEVVDSS